MTRHYALWCFLASAFGICSWLMTTTCIDRGFCHEIWGPTLAMLPYIGWTGMFVIMSSKGLLLAMLKPLARFVDAPPWVPWLVTGPVVLFTMADALANVYVWLQVWDNGWQRVLFEAAKTCAKTYKGLY